MRLKTGTWHLCSAVKFTEFLKVFLRAARMLFELLFTPFRFFAAYGD
jgi:hypothetical protein